MDPICKKGNTFFAFGFYVFLFYIGFFLRVRLVILSNVPHSGFVDAWWCYLICSLTPCVFCKLQVRSKALIHFRLSIFYKVLHIASHQEARNARLSLCDPYFDHGSKQRSHSRGLSFVKVLFSPLQLTSNLSEWHFGTVVIACFPTNFTSGFRGKSLPKSTIPLGVIYILAHFEEGLDIQIHH